MTARLILLALLAVLTALPACGRKGDPDRPARAVPLEQDVEAEGDDDRFFGNPPPAPSPGPDIEEEVDDQLAG